MTDRDACAGPVRTVNLGGGLIVPYPEPVDDAAARIGRANRRVDSACERAVRSALHRMGLRFRVELLVRCDDLGVHVDIAFTRARVAAFVYGCFWHGCPEHQQVPKRNRRYWIRKLQANVDRDRRVDRALARDEWEVVRCWEHEDPGTAAATIAAAVTNGASIGVCVRAGAWHRR